MDNCDECENITGKCDTYDPCEVRLINIIKSLQQENEQLKQSIDKYADEAIQMALIMIKKDKVLYQAKEAMEKSNNNPECYCDLCILRRKALVAIAEALNTK